MFEKQERRRGLEDTMSRGMVYSAFRKERNLTPVEKAAKKL